MLKIIQPCAAVLRMVFIALAFSHGYALAQETAIIKRDTQLRQTPSDSGSPVAALPAQSTVTRTPVRRGAWVQVEAHGTTGWVHMFDLAAPESANPTTTTSNSNPLTEGLRGLGSIFGGGGKTSSVATSTAGARGLDAGDISSPTSPNSPKTQAVPATETVAQVESQRISATQAHSFAKSAGLQVRNVHALAAPPPPVEPAATPPTGSASKSRSTPGNNSGSSGFDLMESGN